MLLLTCLFGSVCSCCSLAFSALFDCCWRLSSYSCHLETCPGYPQRFTPYFGTCWDSAPLGMLKLLVFSPFHLHSMLVSHYSSRFCKVWHLLLRAILHFLSFLLSRKRVVLAFSSAACLIA